MFGRGAKNGAYRALLGEFNFLGYIINGLNQLTSLDNSYQYYFLVINGILGNFEIFIA